MNENIVELLYKIKFTNEKKIAVIFNEETVTYQKLYDMSNVFYNHIIQHYMKKEIVCVICKRSIELIACVIGIIRAGKAYFILEPNDINESIISILNAMPKKVIFVETQNHLIDETVLMGGISGDNIANDSYVMRKGGDLLYLTCTSGTTKNERIIMVEDRNLLCYINAYIKQFNMREKDVVLQQSPVYYDGFAEEIFSMLLVGGTIVLTDTANLKSPQKIVEIVKKHSVSILPSTPLMINELNKLEIMPSIRAIISSGDVLKKSYINNLLEWTNVFNMYGLTETTVCATCYMCSERDDEIIPIGKEIEGYHLELRNMIRSEESNLEIGEIYILGQGVARGYWNIEENVVIKFMENGEQLYKTGDFAWKDRNGILHYVGRKDRQIKIRGNKVNLSHIEEIIYEMNNIDNVVALDCGKMQNICVFFISNQHTIDDIRAFCQRRLVYYMRPVQYFKVNEIPISKTGKVDYKKLREMYDKKKQIKNYDEKSFSNVERRTVQCLIKVLENQIKQINISLNNSWEEIGIDSFTYIQFLVEIEKELNIELNDEVLLKGEFSTVKEFCDYIGEYIGNEE